MKKTGRIFLAVVISVIMVVPVAFAADEMAKKLNDVLSQAPAQKFWQLRADEVQGMINAKKTDFVVIDVRPNPNDYRQGHIPGSLQITIQDILKPDNLRKLPKDKKIILVCVTGQTQNLAIVPLRALGYNAYTVAFGMAAWQKGAAGAKMMNEAVKGAEAKNYPIAK